MKRVGIIGGATGGVGKSLSRVLAEKGDSLVLVARDTSKLEGLRSDILQKVGNANISTEAVDFENPDERRTEQVFSDAYGVFGKIDYLVNCTGLSAWWPFEELSLDLWNKILSVNLTSTYLLNRYAVLFMKKQSGGTIINLSSVAGKKGSPYSGAYCASKFGVVGLSYALAKEVTGHGIEVIVLTPSAISSDFVQKGIVRSHRSLREYAKQKYARKDGIRPESIATLIVAILDLPKDIVATEVAIEGLG